MVFIEEDRSDLDYNFSWFEGAKEQKCKCGAANCRGFIGKRKALPLPPKLETIKKGKKVVSKVNRIVQGRVTKVSRNKVKAQLQNGKVINAIIVASRLKAKTSRKRNVRTTIKKMKSVASSKTTTSLGKRKRANSSSKSVKAPRPSQKAIANRRIANPRPKSLVKLSTPTDTRPIYDTVSHRSRKRNVR